MRIKSIQRGAVSFNTGTSATGTISSVTTANAEIHRLGSHGSDSSGVFQVAHARLELTNATTVTVFVNTAPSGAGREVYVGYQIIEWELAPPSKAMRIKSIQRGSITITGSTTTNNATATIAAVDTARAILRFLGSIGNTDYRGLAKVELTNATTVTARRTLDVGGTSATTVVNYDITEWEEVNV